jgi:multimeric flavodoxin WrbA
MEKVFLINGSPRMDKGPTDMLLRQFAEGLAEAGAEVARYDASRLNIKPCSCGHMTCWYQQPGICCLRDEMDNLYPSLRESSILVLGTPVYSPLPGKMQDFVNRLVVLMDPRIIEKDGRTRARFWPDVKIKKLVLVATCGWWEIENFGTVVRIAEELAANVGIDFAGALLRPHATEMTGQDRKITPEGTNILQAVREAGYRLIHDGSIPDSLLAAISRPLVSRENAT